MSEHSKYFSPSSIARRIACPGSAALEADIVEEGPKPAADWGSFAHHIADVYFNKGTIPKSWIDKEMFGQVCNQEMVDCVNQYIDDIRELQAMYPHGNCASEEQVNLGFNGYPEVFGTKDYSIDQFLDTIVIADLKSGMGVIVDPEHNPQAMLYAIMTGAEYLEQYSKVIIAISQPRAKSGGKSLKIWETTPDILIKWKNEVLFSTIETIKKGNAPLIASPEACHFCKACNICPEYNKQALEVVKADFAADTTPTINDELVSKIYPKLALVKNWIKKVEAHAFEMATTTSLPGYKLVNGRRSRSWKDEDKVADILKEAGIDPYEQKLLTPAKAEKHGKEVKKAIKDHVESTTGKPVIVPETDKRKAITTLTQDFL